MGTLYKGLTGFPNTTTSQYIVASNPREILTITSGKGNPLDNRPLLYQTHQNETGHWYSACQEKPRDKAEVTRVISPWNQVFASCLEIISFLEDSLRGGSQCWTQLTWTSGQGEASKKADHVFSSKGLIVRRTDAAVQMTNKTFEFRFAWQEHYHLLSLGLFNKNGNKKPNTIQKSFQSLAQ